MRLTLRFLLMAPVMFSLGCGNKEASREDLQSEFIQSISLALQTETFIGYMRQGRATYSFASGHLQYLLNEVNRNAQELSSLKASPDLSYAVNLDRLQLNLLAAEIEKASRSLREPNVLAASEQQIRRIRMTLIQANSSL